MDTGGRGARARILSGGRLPRTLPLARLVVGKSKLHPRNVMLRARCSSSGGQSLIDVFSETGPKERTFRDPFKRRTRRHATLTLAFGRKRENFFCRYFFYFDKK